MRCLVVGADRLGTTEEFLRENLSVTKMLHWDGREKKLPPFPDVDVTIIYTGFISHKLMQYAKREAKKRNVKTIFIRRGKAEIKSETTTL